MKRQVRARLSLQLTPLSCVAWQRLASVRTASAILTRCLRRGNLNPFGIYCLLFGAATIIYSA
jgi:undecaprenyl pyrophosphate phosphatase UppP